MIFYARKGETFLKNMRNLVVIRPFLSFSPLCQKVIGAKTKWLLL